MGNQQWFPIFFHLGYYLSTNNILNIKQAMVIYEREIKRLVIPVGYSDQIGGGIPGSCEDAIKEAYKEGKQEQAQEDLSKLESITIRENGVYEPEYGYNHVEVNVSDKKKVVFKVEYSELIFAHNEELTMSVNGIPVEDVGNVQWYGGSPSFIEMSGYTEESMANTIEIEFDAVVESERFPYPQEWDAVYINRSEVEDFTQELEKTQVGNETYHYHYTFTFDRVPLIDVETYDEGYEQATDDIRNNATDLNVTKNGTYSADTGNNKYFKNVVVNVAKTKTLDIYFYFDAIRYPLMQIPPVRNVCYNGNIRPVSVEGLGGATPQGWFAFGFRFETDVNSIYGNGFCEIGVNREEFPSAITKVLIDYKEADTDYVRTSFVEQDGDTYWYRIEWGLLNSTSIRSDYQRGYDDGYSNGKTDGYASGRTDGYSSGWTDGYSSGYTDGYETAESIMDISIRLKTTEIIGSLRPIYRRLLNNKPFVCRSDTDEIRTIMFYGRTIESAVTSLSFIMEVYTDIESAVSINSKVYNATNVSIEQIGEGEEFAGWYKYTITFDNALINVYRRDEIDVELTLTTRSTEDIEGDTYVTFGLYNGRDLTIDGDDYDSTFVKPFPQSVFEIPYVFQTKIKVEDAVIEDTASMSSVTFTVDCNGNDSYVIPTIQTLSIHGHPVTNMSCSYVEITPSLPTFYTAATYTITFDEISIL